jgi:hypothetical protein
VADGILFERLGTPAVAIVTDAFPQSSDAMARLQGAPGYRYLAVPHPMSSLSVEQCHERAAEILPEVLEILGVGAQAPIAAEGEATSQAARADCESELLVSKVALDELVFLIEGYYERGWTDGMPVVPVGPQTIESFLAAAGIEADEPILAVEHLQRTCTGELAAVAAAMAGCRPEHFPVVVAAARALQPLAATGLLQSTTGQAVFIAVNGPIRGRLGFNAANSVLGPGYRANATVGRAIRLMIMNALEIRPGAFDQSTQGTPGKYCLCVAENEEASPWEPAHLERGFSPEQSAVTVHLARSTLAVENRTSADPEAVLLTIADAMSYAGAAGCRAATVLMGPEHAALCARAGWDRASVRRFLFEHWGRPRADLERFGLAEGDGLASHAPAVAAAKAASSPPSSAYPSTAGDFVRFGDSPEAIFLVVAGAANAGVSTVIPAHRPMRHDVAFHSALVR